jgi:hypothetical protein
MNDVKATTVNVDVSEAVRGLKLLQREARKTVQALREVDGETTTRYGDTWLSYTDELRKCINDDGIFFLSRYINQQLYDATVNSTFKNITIHYKRGDGATTSAIAALKTFDDVTYITRHQVWVKPFRELRAYGIDEPLRGNSNLRNARVILLDANLPPHVLSAHYELGDRQRTITLYGHED